MNKPQGHRGHRAISLRRTQGDFRRMEADFERFAHTDRPGGPPGRCSLSAGTFRMRRSQAANGQGIQTKRPAAVLVTMPAPFPLLPRHLEKKSEKSLCFSSVSSLTLWFYKNKSLCASVVHRNRGLVVVPAGLVSVPSDTFVFPKKKKSKCPCSSLCPLRLCD